MKPTTCSEVGRHSTQAPARLDEARRRIAVEAARLISESGLRDYQQAKRKAAARLGFPDSQGLPTNQAIDDALREHQRLFSGTQRVTVLRRLRETAREAMHFFSAFEPRLVGAVLDGSADHHSAVCLHLFADQPESVLARLGEHAIPFDLQDRRLRLDRHDSADFPALRFHAGDTVVDLTILPYDGLRQAPLDRVSGRPMQRAGLAALDALLQEDPD